LPKAVENESFGQKSLRDLPVPPKAKWTPDGLVVHTRTEMAIATISELQRFKNLPPKMQEKERIRMHQFLFDGPRKRS